MLIFGCGNGGNGTKNDAAESTLENYQIGHEHVIFYDAQRDNRDVSAELFYPYLTGGEKNDITEESFPLIVFAHGYQQRYSDYDYIYEALVPQGYLLAFLTTEQGLSINIDTYAEDILFLHQALHNSETAFSGHIADTSALMGHSTGGGAIYLAHAASAQSTTLISLAALGEPYGPIIGSSPIDVAHEITAPSLILSGDQDCITPVDLHQKPLYDALAGDKRMVTISGGDHCGFSDSGNCPIAESLACGVVFQGATINEAQQRALSLELMTPWLAYYLKKDLQAWTTFESLLQE